MMRAVVPLRQRRYDLIFIAFFCVNLFLHATGHTGPPQAVGVPAIGEPAPVVAPR